MAKGRTARHQTKPLELRTSAYVPLVGGSHMARSIISGVWTFTSLMEGHRSKWMLAEQQIPPLGAYSFLHKWPLQIEEVVIYLGSSGYHIT